MREARPWYREPWPWLVMAPVAAVVVAGIATTAIAVTTFDGVVADDYYKQGLGINRTLEREARAQALGIEARFVLNEERDAVRVTVAAKAALPETLTLRLTHPTLRGEDQAVTLRSIGPSMYEARLRKLRHATWNVSLEEEAGGWRVVARLAS